MLNLEKKVQQLEAELEAANQKIQQLQQQLHQEQMRTAAAGHTTGIMQQILLSSPSTLQPQPPSNSSER
jgi:phage shock protein A